VNNSIELNEIYYIFYKDCADKLSLIRKTKMKTNYSPQCAFPQNEDIFNFSDNLNLSDDEYSLSCSSNSANAFKFKDDLNFFISK